MSDKKSKIYMIIFCVKPKEMITEIKEMLDAAYNESDISQASIYRWFNEFKSSSNSLELMGGLGTPTTVLAEQTINIGATMILDDPTVRISLLSRKNLLCVKLCVFHFIA